MRLLYGPEHGDHRPHPVGVVDGVLEQDLAAHGVPDQDRRLVEPDLVDHHLQIGREPLDGQVRGLGLRRQGRSPVAPVVPQDHPVAVPEVLHDVRPEEGRHADAVAADQRRTLAHIPDVELLSVVGGGEAGANLCHRDLLNERRPPPEGAAALVEEWRIRGSNP